jgi:hypothetical protein
MDIIDPGAEEMHMTIHRHTYIEDDVRQFIARIGNRRNRDEGAVDVDRARELWQLLPPVFILRQLQ